MGLSVRRKRKKARRRIVPRSRWQRWLFRWGWIFPVGALLIGAGILVLTYAFASIPLPQDIKLDSSAEVYDRSGRPIGTFSGTERRFLIDTTKIPDYVEQAVLAAEDKNFYDHNGVSVRGIIRAAWANATGGEIAQGGSTITQQYIKNAVLRDSERTVARKAKEAILAIKLERRYSKKEILDFYLNTIYLGRGAYGVEAAARVYFNRHATELTLPQAAYLASIIPSPESYQPDENPSGARDRRNRVLRIMNAEGYITDRQLQRASRHKVDLDNGQFETNRRQKAAYFMEWIRKDFLERDFGPAVYTGGLRVHTSLDLRMQKLAEDAVDQTLTEPTDPNAALVSMTPRGEVRALVGGKTHDNVKQARGVNFAADIRRQAGSSFKPFTLVTAIEEGISPSSRFSGSSSVTIDDPLCETNGESWKPSNYGNSSFGTITLDQATTNSVNTVYAQLASEVGPGKIADVVEEFGFDKPVSPVCSLSLGTKDVSPVQMARGYAGFAARGVLPTITPIRYVTDSAGNCLREYVPRDEECEKEYESQTKRVVSKNSADVLNQTLTNVVEGGTATRANIGREVSGKTGTTQENKDAWFAGSIPQLTTVVWMGYRCETLSGKNCQPSTPEAKKVVPTMGYCSDPFKCRPVHGIEVTGGSFPAEIWAKYMAPATQSMQVETFPTPEDLPDEIINSPAPYVPVPVPTDTKKPNDKPSKSPDPTPVPTLAPTEPPPSPSPTDPLPTPTNDPESAAGGDP